MGSRGGQRGGYAQAVGGRGDRGSAGGARRPQWVGGHVDIGGLAGTLHD